MGEFHENRIEHSPESGPQVVAIPIFEFRLHALNIQQINKHPVIKLSSNRIYIHQELFG